MKTAFLALVVFCFCPYLARGEPIKSARADIPRMVSESNSSVPDVSGWTIVDSLRIMFLLSDADGAVAYLGLDTEYRNPENPNEFVRIISRHVPMIFITHKPQSERLLSEMIMVFYDQKEKQDRLNNLDKKTDPICYMRWRTKKDVRTGKDRRDGDFEVWFLQLDGSWPTTPTINERVVVQFLSENVGNGAPHNVFAGRKYQLGGSYHILKVDRRDRARLAEGGK